MHFYSISTQFFGMFSYLSALLVLVIFGNLSLRKNVFCKSDGIKFNTFSTCFVDLVPSLVFLCMFLFCWCHFVFHLAPISRKNPFRKSFQKKVPPCLKLVTMTVARGSLTAPLACALLKQETIVRAQNVVRIRVHGSGFGNLFENCCLSWFRL